MQHIATIAPTFDDPLPEPRRRFQRVLLRDLDTTVHPRMRQAVGAAQTWIEGRMNGNRRASLVLVATGKDTDKATGFGCGKTHIARAGLHTDCYWVDDVPIAAVGKFWIASELMDELGRGGPLSHLAETGNIIVIDDVGAEQILEYVAAGAQAVELQNRYFRIVNHCYENHTSVIVTGNMTLGELKAHIGGRAWSRLQQMCPPGCIVDMTGVPDYRLTLRKLPAQYGV